MDEQVQSEPELKPEVQIISYEGDSIIVPTHYIPGRIAEDYIRDTIKVRPDVKKILWNDIVSGFVVRPNGVIEMEW